MTRDALSLVVCTEIELFCTGMRVVGDDGHKLRLKRGWGKRRNEGALGVGDGDRLRKRRLNHLRDGWSIMEGSEVCRRHSVDSREHSSAWVLGGWGLRLRLTDGGDMEGAVGRVRRGEGRLRGEGEDGVTDILVGGDRRRGGRRGRRIRRRRIRTFIRLGWDRIGKWRLS